MGLFDLFKKKQDSIESQPADYSEIDSNEKAQELYDKGQLSKLHLVSLDFGGEDSLLNSLFVPRHAKEKKEKFDLTLMKMLQDGLKLGFKANPEYKGKSFIPSKIVINVTGDKTLTETIDIW